MRLTVSICTFCMLHLWALPSAGQLTGRVVDRASQVPVERGFVVLLDADGGELRRVLSGRDGRFSFRGLTPGVYHLRSERIGYRVQDSGPITVDATGVVDFVFAVTPLPIVLNPINVTEGGGCSAMGGGEGFLEVWEEIRKALMAASWTAGGRVLRHDVRSFNRELDRRRRSVLDEVTQERTAVSAMPFRSLPAERLAEEGYVVQEADGSLQFYAPDADVLLSDVFRDTHCFALIDGQDDRKGQLGLRFSPLPDRTTPDVEGELWVNRQTAELTALAFRYHELPIDVSHPAIGGTVEFASLPTGAWVIRRWVIRMPQTEVRREIGVTAPARVTRITGFREMGAEIARATTPDGTLLYSEEFARVSGMVVDSVGGAPMRGALVSVVGTEYRTRTDAAGRFALAGPMSGDYGIAVTSPVLDSLGWTFPVERVRLGPGVDRSFLWTGPTAGDAVAALCGDPDVGRVVIGVVRDGATVTTGASVTMSWDESSGPSPDTPAATTDESGRFVFCGVPAGRHIAIRARDGTKTSGFAAVMFAGDSAPVSGAGGTPATTRPVWRHDLELFAKTGRTELSGTVVVEPGSEPVANATVRLAHTDLEVATDAAGAFHFPDAPFGSHRLLVRRLGYEPLAIDIDVRRGEQNRLDADRVTLSAAPPVLDPVVVSATAPDRRLEADGFYRRARRGIGTFLREEDFANRNPATVTDIFRRLPDFRVIVNARYGLGEQIDSRRYLVVLRRTVGGQMNDGQCPVVFYVNGIHRGDSVSDDIDLQVDPLDVIAVEAYSEAQVPARFTAPSAACGVIAIWTR